MPIPLNISNPLQPQADSLGSTAVETVQTQNVPKPEKPKVDAKRKKLHEEFLQRKDTCKSYRRKLVANWTVSIDYRRGKPFTSQPDEDSVAVNVDWVLTKSKQAALFSQVPEARINHSPDTLPKTAPWAAPFERRLNDKLKEAGIEAAMDECLPDCINAAGIGVVLVSYESLTETKQVPTNEDEPEGDMETVDFPAAKRYLTQRISPADLLWPINFTGSNFDNAPWIGRSGRVTWAEAVQRFKLTEDEKETVLGEDRTTMDRLTHDVERDRVQADEMVGFDEIWYKEHAYDPECKSYTSIRHLVFITGKDDPVIDEPWKGQRLVNGDVIGAQRYPLRVLTLAYITDETIPPSDSSIGRAQVNEINRGRTQMIRQRERSLPVRYGDVNRLDPAIMQSLMRGTWQNFIPVQGDGSRIIGEVARATMPQENFMFYKIAKADLNESWSMEIDEKNQLEEVKGDPNQNKASFNTQAGRERAKVASFFVAIAEVLSGLMCLFEDEGSFGEGFDPSVSKLLRLSILADSTVLLDAGQKLSRLNQFIENYAKSGWINVEPVLQEIAILSGLDPSAVVVAPNPKPPVEPNISLRLTGVEDMLNPLALAFLIKSGQAPDQDLIEKAKELIQKAVEPPAGLQQPSFQKPGGFPMLPEQGGDQGGGGGAGSVLPNVAPPGQTPGGSPTPQPAPPAVGEAHPQWTHMTTLGKRTEGGGKQ